MSFADDLWDGFEKVNSRISDGLSVYKDISDFYKRRANVETQYAGDLIKMVKACSKGKGHYKGGPLTGSFGTVGDSWTSIQEETEKLAKFHLDLSTKLDEQVCAPINQFVKDGEKQRSAIEKEGKNKQKSLANVIEAMNRSKAKFHKLSKEAEDAQVASEKARTDDAMKPQQISKLCAKASQSNEKSKQADAEYQESVQAANSAQQHFISVEMPKVLADFQKMEESRIDAMQATLKKFLLVQEAVPPCIELVCQAISQSVASISKASDVQQFIEDTKTGKDLPESFEYVAYEGRIREPEAPAAGSSAGAGPEEDILNDNEDLSQLTPDARRARLAEKIESAKGAIKAAIKERKGLDHLVSLYDAQPEAKAKVTEELAEAKNRINALRDRKHELEQWLANEGGAGTPAGSDSNEFDGQGDQGGERSVLFQVRALYAYTAQEGTELSFNEGDVMNVVNEYEGWWDAELNGRYGLIPSTYVERM